MSSHPGRQEIIGQLAYLAEELEAQKSVFGLIPPALISAEPIAGDPSIARLYGLMLEREMQVFAPACVYLGGLDQKAPAMPTDEELLSRVDAQRPVESVMEAIRRERRSLVEAIDTLDQANWATPRPLRGQVTTLLAFAYEMTQQDADVLRRISTRLYEGQMGAPRVRSH